MRRFILLLHFAFIVVIPLHAQLVQIDDGPTDMFLTRPAVIEFTAEWCKPSKELEPTLNRLAREFSGQVDFYTVDIEDSDFFKEQGFQSIPLLLFLYDYDDKSDRISYFGVPNLISYTTASSHVGDMLSRWNQSFIDRQHFVSQEYVDLGLSVMWATCNLGADRPNSNGAYYSWGETTTKHFYDTESYKYYVDADGFYSLSKYNDDGVVILSSEDDVANTVLGNGWHIPSFEQWVELINNCSWEETTLDGCEGWRATGPNGNSIFFPYAGIREDCYNVGRNNGIMGYWTNEAHERFTHRAYFFGRTREGDIGMDHEDRYYGFSIRPIKDKIN